MAPRSQASPTSFTPLPQTALGALHVPLLQVYPAPPGHGWPSCVASATASQTWVVPLHCHLSHAGGAAVQSVAGLLHENVQLVLQPSPFVALPSSHCSPGSTTLLPQIAVVQTAILQYLPTPHDVPS